ncbi:YidC/Oxa1 family membrane protein insertase [Clostridium sp. DJ247]|uniref:YidC/Oxa1 family membrane protein insertase n=1 Tax=Clostridium sp. DJ247 TaxID=2726188 RepID=UPI001624F291|nr:YidC/Oxa1 family membrane protein insertase [Clostridium sp. DJ247]MBC2582273.1 YidC/Oxa1 family membrane protein insertase [Clostridium sp. DJ247]
MNIILNILNTALSYLFSITGDYGISIILLTVLVRVILLPMSLKQKNSIQQQQVLSKKIEELKIKYKDNKEKFDSEIQKYYQQSAKSMFGCLVTLIQLPIISSLFIVFNKMPVHVGTIIVPWITNLKMPDNYFIIPIIYTLISLSPSFISHIPFLKIVKEVQVQKITLILTSIVSLLITFKAPIAIGIYLITTGLFSLFEEIIYRLYMKNKCLN